MLLRKNELFTKDDQGQKRMWQYKMYMREHRTTCILVNRIIYRDSCWQETDFIIAGERKRGYAYKEKF